MQIYNEVASAGPKGNRAPLLDSRQKPAITNPKIPAINKNAESPSILK